MTAAMGRRTTPDGRSQLHHVSDTQSEAPREVVGHGAHTDSARDVARKRNGIGPRQKQQRVVQIRVLSVECVVAQLAIAKEVDPDHQQAFAAGRHDLLDDGPDGADTRYVANDVLQ
jgi:hypothetical protein